MEWAENVTGMVDAKERGEIQGQCEDITMTLKNQDMMVCGAHLAQRGGLHRDLRSR
jgi:hypothetical protein